MNERGMKEERKRSEEGNEKRGNYRAYDNNRTQDKLQSKLANVQPKSPNAFHPSIF